ncbi:vWA domain-containing protein [Yinghuangia soli]|uniref:VWA domain-containing protein n=1 Tax=Yinghuangia soli TaxID=2908204 RepID=A0AA41Q5Q2_9ACTN|nr:vWA domain-containing protein [Yinghuangia soli]MCF2531470.1 VWA domain-containing protein [Yinghuangia soli]
MHPTSEALTVRRRRTARRTVQAAAAALVGGLLTAAAPAAVPPADPATSVVTVRTGGDRAGDAVVGPLAGVRLALYADADAAAPLPESWAACTSDADGDCSFTIPDTGRGGANAARVLHVGQPADGVPAGWFTSTSLRTGAGSGSGSVQSPYRFPTPALVGGQTYRSTGDFMRSTDYAASPYVASGGIWQQSRTNPPLPQACGLDIALVLDLSASVGSALPSLKKAADGFADALTGTPSRLALFSFDRSSPSAGADANHPDLMSVSTTEGATAFKQLYAGWSLGSGTNWDQGLYAVAKAAPHYDAVVVLTDGNPTYWNNPREGDGSHTHFADVEGGIFAANAVKAENTRVVALGVGKGVEGVSGLNLRAISGPTAFDGTNPTTADYFQTADFDTAGQALHDIALTHCDGTLSVIKQIVPAGNTGEDVTGSTSAGGGWEFTATSTTAGIGGLPDTQRTPNTRAVGGVVFQPTFPPAVPEADITVTEAQQPGHTLVTRGGKNAVCTNLDTGAPLPVTNTGTADAPGFTVDVPRLAAVSCVVHNRPPLPADVAVSKQWSIDGVTYTHSARPPGYDAALTLTGPAADAGASAQDWDTVRTGYTAGSATTLAETATLPDSCTLVDSRVVTANGTQVAAPLPYTAQLPLAHNTFTVRNTVTCTTTPSPTPTPGTPTPTPTPGPSTHIPSPPAPAIPAEQARSGGALPRTGAAHLFTGIVVGCALLAAGALALAATRNRRRT